MAKSFDTRLIAVVAQEAFEVEYNHFCKLAPMAYVDGTQPSGQEFPNDGEVWWMLKAETRHLAKPGHLVSCLLEKATKYVEGEPSSSCYQAQRDSVRALSVKEDGLEVIELEADAIDRLDALVSNGFSKRLPYQPTPKVMLRWRGHVYGPFSTKAEAESEPAAQRISFTPAADANNGVYKVSIAAFNDAAGRFLISGQERISLTSHRRSEAKDCVDLAHELLLGKGYEQMLAINPEKEVLETLDGKLLRLSKTLLTRTKRQQLRKLMEELEIAGREAPDVDDINEAIGHIRQVSEKQDIYLNSVAKALLESGVLGEDRLRNAEQAFGEKYIEDRTAELQAKIEENIEGSRKDLRRVQNELKGAEERLRREEATRRTEFDHELAAMRNNARRAIAAEQEEFDKQKEELKRQESALRHNLVKVTNDLRDAGDEVVNKFLAIAPLLGSVGLVGTQTVHQERRPTMGDMPPSTLPFELPAYITAPAAHSNELMEEMRFFNRFQRVVEDSGFSYRALDLQRFHLSVKCGDITVVGGPSGTGKSSLPALYAHALIGDEGGNGRPGCLMVNVNPAWMDIRDLLGHMNTLEGRFCPTESGLFKHLVYAQKEQNVRGQGTGVYMVCLDEMNLSQVEHYFSDLMMVLERDGGQRTVQCFTPEAVRGECPFREYSRVSISPALRFVGTVNFDETTRLLSDRFLDRVNLIRLSSAALPNAGGASKAVGAQGRMVTLGDFQAWRMDVALPSELASLLDQMRPLLTQMGCPISPRVYRSICRFVGSAKPIMQAPTAFDIQVAQRIVPKIRTLITNRQIDALDGLVDMMSKSNVCSFEESAPMLHEIKESAGSMGWDLEG